MQKLIGYLAFLFSSLLLLTTGLCLGQADSSSDQTNWPAFRGNGMSQTSVTNLPEQWDDEKNVAWKIELPGYGQSSPVIWGGRVFVTTMQGDSKEAPTILGLGIADGKEIWKQEFKSSQKIKASDYVTRSSPTPVIDSERVYAFFESGDLIATDHDGEVLWQRSLVDEYGKFKGNHGVGSSLAINDKFVFALVAHEGPSYLLAVNKSTGENVWKTDLEPKVSWSSPIVVGKHVLLSISGSVRGFDATTGDPIWTTDNIAGNTVASPTVVENVAYIGSSQRENSVAIEFDQNGTLDSAKVLWKAEEATSSFGSPLYHDGHVYFVNKQGVAFAVDAATGKTTWKQRISGSCWASPISAGSRIYFFTKEGTTDVFKAGVKPKLLHSNKLAVKDRIYGVAVANDRFIIRTGTQLICLANQGEQEKEAPAVEKLTLADMPVPVTSFGAAVCEDFLYVYGGNKADAHTYSAEGQNGKFRRIKLESGSKWESLGEVPRRQGNALVSYKGKVYRLGGFEAKNKLDEDDEELVSTADFAVYDPATSKWTSLTPLPEPRSSFDAVVAGDILYVVGGWALKGDRGDSRWHGTAWQMDLSHEKPEWKTMPAPEERRANSLAELDGKVYLIGGMGDDARPTTSVSVFDTKTQKWSEGPNLPGQSMDGFGSSSFNVGGRIVVSTFSGQVVQLSADGKSWEKIQQLETGRFFHRLVGFDNTRFLILGGTSASSNKQASVLVLESAETDK